MLLLQILRIAGWAAAAAAVVYSIISLGRRVGIERRGRKEVLPGGTVSSKEADAAGWRVHGKDALSSAAHFLFVIGLVAGVTGHAASPFREIPGVIGLLAGIAAAAAFYGGALLLSTGSLIPLARRLGGRGTRFTRGAADVAPLLSQILLGASGAFYYGALWSESSVLQAVSGVFHSLTAAFFIACISDSKLYHILGFSRLMRAGIPRLTGVLPRDPGVDALRGSEGAETVRIGLSGLEDLTSLQRIEASACISCGLCDQACPAAGKGGLSPKRLTRAQAELMIAKGTKAGGEFSMRLLEETAACTHCYACETACPFSIRKVDRVAGLRRYAVLEKGRVPPLQKQALRNVEKSGNTLDMDPEARRRLLKEAGIPILGGERPDYVLWLGCQAAYDPRMRPAVLAVAEMLRASGAKLAALEEEACCGELPRRIGEENLFLDLVRKNAEAFSGLNGIPILTLCPHCAVSLGRDYAEIGARVKAVHYTEILGRLAAGTGMAPAPAARPLRVAYHDSCYVAKLLGVVEEPRGFLGRERPDVELVRLEREGADALCCGGGGGGMLMDEKPEDRMALRVIDELTRKKADVLLVSCPNCLALYGDAAAFRGSGIRVMDLAEFAALPRGIRAAEGARQG